MEQLLTDRHVKLGHGTNARLEHVDVPDGEGYIRWHYIRRDSEPDSLGTGNDADSGLVLLPAQARLRQALDLLKRNLLFWR